MTFLFLLFLAVLSVTGMFAFGRVIFLIPRFITNKKERKSTFKSIIISTLVAIIGIFCLVSRFAFPGEEIYKEHSTFYDLVALEDSSNNLHYEKHIFSMRIDKRETPIYRFYYRDSDGDINFQEKNVEDVSLVYPDAEPKYEIIKHTKTVNYNFWGFIHLSSEDDEDDLKECYVNDYVWYEYKLHLPEGSLVTDINIDME